MNLLNNSKENQQFSNEEIENIKNSMTFESKNPLLDEFLLSFSISTNKQLRDFAFSRIKEIIRKAKFDDHLNLFYDSHYRKLCIKWVRDKKIQSSSNHEMKVILIEFLIDKKLLVGM